MRGKYISLLWLLPAVLLTSCSHEGRQKLEAAKAAQIEKYKTELAENQRLVAESDSLLALLVPAINEATNAFVFEKNESDVMGRWYIAGTEPVNNIGRTYLRMDCDEEGVLHTISTYAGSSDLNYLQLQVSASDGTFCTTDSVPFSSDLNYHYQTTGSRYEVITFLAGTGVHSLAEAKERNNGSVKYDTDGGVAAFIAAHALDGSSKQTSLKVTLLGGKKPVSYSLTTKELVAMQQTVSLAALLQQRLAMQQQNRVAANKVKYLQGRIAEHER